MRHVTNWGAIEERDLATDVSHLWGKIHQTHSTFLGIKSCLISSDEWRQGQLPANILCNVHDFSASSENNLINFTKVGEGCSNFFETLKWDFPHQGLARVKEKATGKQWCTVPKKLTLSQFSAHKLWLFCPLSYWCCLASRISPWGWAAIAPSDLIPGGQTFIYCITELLPEQAIPDFNENAKINVYQITNTTKIGHVNLCHTAVRLLLPSDDTDSVEGGR